MASLRASRTVLLPGLAFLACALILGLPYWAIPYAQVSLPGALMVPGLLVVPIAALALRFPLRSSFLAALSAPGLAVPAAVLVRVGWEVAKDPTSHNLWPFEVVLAGLVGFGAALGGAILGSLLALLIHRQPRG